MELMRHVRPLLTQCNKMFVKCIFIKQIHLFFSFLQTMSNTIFSYFSNTIVSMLWGRALWRVAQKRLVKYHRAKHVGAIEWKSYGAGLLLHFVSHWLWKERSSQQHTVHRMHLSIHRRYARSYEYFGSDRLWPLFHTNFRVDFIELPVL